MCLVLHVILVNKTWRKNWNNLCPCLIHYQLQFLEILYRFLIWICMILNGISHRSRCSDISFELNCIFSKISLNGNWDNFKFREPFWKHQLHRSNKNSRHPISVMFFFWENTIEKELYTTYVTSPFTWFCNQTHRNTNIKTKLYFLKKKSKIVYLRNVCKRTGLYISYYGYKTSS